ncbi:ROK family protein [Paenibacillus sp. 1011MAR3C5]|uniref:ROK family protein n=1 Tax=Paenibacillus sp. 1011MAR3C5 TaxID=1675787 RepID=UPI000E6BADFE|nr:ROK family protein [Paenibacillus sp. 1011MAR3C5]RJE87444.1 ROK family protein [Paenibacillus sp. 1011MAR3C5]
MAPIGEEAMTTEATELFDPSSKYAIGIDIGGTKINAGIVTHKGEILLSESLETLAGQENTVRRVQQAIQHVIEEASKTWPDIRYRGIGIGSAGQVDWHEGSIRYASELIPGYSGAQLKSILEKQYGMTVWVDNDVNVIALAEMRLGAGLGKRQFICLALGTGVGGAVVIDGRLLHGAWGGAGELGHMSVDFRGIPCICGARGCLEQYASGTSIARLMRERLAAIGTPNEQVNARDVFALWQEGDPLAASVMDEMIAALGSAITSLIHIFNPELIIIGGGVAESGEQLVDRLRQEVSRHTMPSFAEGVQIETARLGNWSGMIGAALQAWEYE